MDIIGGATAPHDSDPDAEYDFEDDFATDHTRKASADLSSFSSSAPSPASQRLSSRITSDAAANGSNVIMNKIPHTASLSADEGSKVLEGFPAHDAPKASADAIAVSSSAPSPTGLILPFQAPPPVAHHGVNTTPVTTPLRSRPSFSSLGDCGLAEWIHASPPPCEPSDLDHRSNEGTDNMVLPQDDLHTKNHQTSLHLVFEEYFTYYEGEQIRHNSVSLPTGRTQANVIAVIPTGDSRARHMECDVFNIESTSRAPPLEPRGSVFLASQGGKWAIDRSIHSPDTASSSDSGADIGSPGVDGDPNERHVAPAPEDQSSDSSCSVFNTSASPSNSVRKTNSPCEREAAMPPKIRGPSRVEAQPDTPGGIPELADERQIVDRTHHEAGPPAGRRRTKRKIHTPDYRRYTDIDIVSRYNSLEEHFKSVSQTFKDDMLEAQKELDCINHQLRCSKVDQSANIERRCDVLNNKLRVLNDGFIRAQSALRGEQQEFREYLDSMGLGVRKRRKVVQLSRD